MIERTQTNIGKPNGTGKFLYSSGDRFEGSVVDGLRHGEGKLFFSVRKTEIYTTL